MHRFRVRQMLLHGSAQAHPVTLSPDLFHLYRPNNDAAVTEVDIFHSQAQTFQEPKTAPINEIGHEAIRRRDMGQQRADLGACQNHRHPQRAATRAKHRRVGQVFAQKTADRETAARSRPDFGWKPKHSDLSRDRVRNSTISRSPNSRG